jgi:hypothetical protein
MLFGKRKLDETDSYVMWEVMGPGMEQPKIIIDYYPMERCRLQAEEDSIN